MNDSPAIKEPRRSSALGLSRLARLARKELRETLRDRRTIITLVLMPLLVYPVLSLAFRQFLLSSFQQSREMHWRLAVVDEEEGHTFMMHIANGQRLLQQREQSATAQAPSTVGPLLGADLGTTEPPLDNIDVVLLEDLDTAVLNGDIDLGIQLLRRPAEDDKAQNEPRNTFQLVFRPTSPTSRQAASFVERRLRAVNEAYVTERLQKIGESGQLPAGWRLRPVAIQQGHSFWLGTLVPLVLILMTITGAVYPAIDLTAGERERGTLEPLMAAPVPRLMLLMGKYVAVLAVAMLTAVINLTAMTVTVASSGLGPVLFGSGGLTAGSIVAVLALLLLFAAFFSAVLLSITSFARSFKEAQAYLIPLMLVSLGPGFMSVMPGLELGPLLSVIPLANIVLLARDVLEGDAPALWGSVAVLTTLLYGAFALALAARIFGSDAILYGSQNSWGDLLRRPDQPRLQATVSGALTALAIIAPLFVISGGILAQFQSIKMSAQLMATVGTTLLLFLVFPMGLARLQGVSIRDGFQLRGASLLALAGGVLLGVSLWPLAYNLIILCQDLGLATLSAEKLAENRPGFDALLARWRSMPIAAILLAMAVAPAVCEELFFRGYLLGALRGRMRAWAAIALTGAVFGLFHASVGGLIAVERIISSAFLGLVLGWVCWVSRSVLPGMLLHVLNNGLMLALAYYAPRLQAWGWDAANQRYLPMIVVAAACLGVVAGLAAVWIGRLQTVATAAALPEATAG